MNTTINQKDIYKGQKIVAAIYLITAHLSDREPIRHSLRDLSISFVRSVSPLDLLADLDVLLGAASLAGLISEKNTSVVMYEARRYAKGAIDEGVTQTLEALFGSEEMSGPQTSRQGHVIKDSKKTYSALISKTEQKATNYTGYQNKKDSSGTITSLTKDSRQDKILSFINERKSAVIKDITALFPEVSEKTIQRELGTLIETGRITKRGSKRWSMYMAVNSLL